ncbi:MAG TPA: LytTR family DNA-binding domain-containing protein [Bacilli bacterium]
MQMPVLKRNKNDGSSKLVVIELSDVLYIKIEDRTIVYHTADALYYHISTLSDLEDHLFDFGFDTLDKTNIVNLNKIKKLDTQHGNIYFDEEPMKSSKYASIAFIKQKLLKHELARIIANNTNTTLEYTAKSNHSQALNFKKDFTL